MRRKPLLGAPPAAVVAIGLVVAASGSPAQTPTTRATDWERRLPGVPVAQVDLPARTQTAVRAALAISPQVDGRSVRTVTQAGALGRSLMLLAAAGPGGRPCFTFVTDKGGTREFACTGDGSSSLVRFLSFGGTTLGSVEWVTLTGIARGDIERVGLVTVGGPERMLRLDRWGAFAYATNASDALPVALRAYDVAGALVEEVAASP